MIRIFDDKTGEAHPTPPILCFGTKKIKGRKWMILFQDYLERLAKDVDLGGVDYRVLMYLIHSMEYENLVNVTQQYVADELNLAQPQVNRSIRKLTEKNYLKKHIYHGRMILAVNEGLVRKGVRGKKLA
jgi:hypothetical protein